MKFVLIITFIILGGSGYFFLSKNKKTVSYKEKFVNLDDTDVQSGENLDKSLKIGQNEKIFDMNGDRDLTSVANLKQDKSVTDTPLDQDVLNKENENSEYDNIGSLDELPEEYLKVQSDILNNLNESNKYQENSKYTEVTEDELPKGFLEIEDNITNPPENSEYTEIGNIEEFKQKVGEEKIHFDDNGALLPGPDISTQPQGNYREMSSVEAEKLLVGVNVNSK